jgi:hypothetical protein
MAVQHVVNQFVLTPKETGYSAKTVAAGSFTGSTFSVAGYKYLTLAVDLSRVACTAIDIKVYTSLKDPADITDSAIDDWQPYTAQSVVAGIATPSDYIVRKTAIGADWHTEIRLTELNHKSMRIDVTTTAATTDTLTIRGLLGYGA